MCYGVIVRYRYWCVTIAGVDCCIIIADVGPIVYSSCLWCVVLDCGCAWCAVCCSLSLWFVVRRCGLLFVVYCYLLLLCVDGCWVLLMLLLV